jgi:acyl carrier protein
MTRQTVLHLVEEMLELTPNTLAGPEKLTDVPGWDSLATVNFIATVDGKLGVTLPGKRVLACRTVDDLVGLLVADADKRAA